MKWFLSYNNYQLRGGRGVRPPSDRALHVDGLADDLGRLRDRQWWWSSIQHSGVPIQPARQHLWAEAVLGEPRSYHVNPNYHSAKTTDGVH